MREATAAGWRSRAAAKLVGIDERHRLLRTARTVVDLGAAPGGWSQVVSGRVAAGAVVVGVDLLACEPLPGVEFLRADFTDPAVREAVRDRVAGRIDVLLSDAAPDLSGNRARDDAACERLHEAVFAMVDECAVRCLVIKSFSGAAQQCARDCARARGFHASFMRPSATRKHSSEVYLVAKAATTP